MDIQPKLLIMDVHRYTAGEGLALGHYHATVKVLARISDADFKESLETALIDAFDIPKDAHVDAHIFGTQDGDFWTPELFQWAVNGEPCLFDQPPPKKPADIQ